MSRLGKKEILIPEGVTATLDGRTLTIVGPKGTLNFSFRPEVAVQVSGGKILVKAGEDKLSKVIWGTTRQIIAGIVEGVSHGWSKTLEIVGTGYRAVLEDGKLVFSLGFSHKIEVAPVEGITFSVSENKVTISGADKALVGKIAAQIRQFRLPDSYKGKGIRYLGERVKLKPGKATKVGAAVGK